MQNFFAPYPQTFMAESIFTIQVSFYSTISIESVLLIKVHVESQIVCLRCTGELVRSGVVHQLVKFIIHQEFCPLSLGFIVNESSSAKFNFA